MTSLSNADYQLAVYRKKLKDVKIDEQQITTAINSNDDSQMKSVHQYIDGKYGAYIPDWGKGMYGFNSTHGFNYELLNTDSLIFNLNYMRAKIDGYALGLSKQNSNGSPQSNTVSVNVTNNNEFNASLTFEQARCQIEDMTSLTDEETKEILERIASLEKIVGSREKKKTKWEKAKPILSWLADKSFDVGMTLLPLLLKVGK